MGSATEWTIREFREEDAPKLAKLFNESEEGWPGGLTGGIPYTAERVLEKIRSSDAIAHYVTEIDGQLVGYLELNWHWLGRDSAYISLVNVHPDYRGRGIGTSLLKKAILKSISVGVDRVDLHTWPGNSRAIRLYKRLGFFWVPKTQVYMQNYLPMIIKNPLARDFFKEGTESIFNIVREISIEEDDLKVKGRGVYVYEWRRDGNQFKVYIDREGWGICGIEWNEGVIELYPEEEEVIRGLTATLAWRVCNYSNKPLTVTLIPDCESGVRIVERPKNTFTIQPEDETVVRGKVLVDMNAPRKERDEPALRVKTLVLLNKKLINLIMGLRCDYPVSLKFLEPLLLYPKFSGEVLLNVKNNTKKPISCTLTVVNSKQLEINPTRVIIELGKEETRTVPLKVKVKDPSIAKSDFIISSELMIDGNKIKNKLYQFTGVVQRPGEVIGYFDEDKKAVVICKDRLLFVFQLKGGALHVVDRLYNDRIAYHRGESLGPPFWPNELSRTYYDFNLEGDRYHVKLLLKAKLRKYPGVELKKTFEFFGHSPLIKIVYEIINNTSKELNLQLQIHFSPSLWLTKSLVVPLKNGVLISRIIPGEFPSTKGDLPLNPEKYSEYWSCYVLKNKMTCGLLWAKENLTEVDFSYCKLPSLKYNILLKPYSRLCLAPLYMYIGIGSWRDIEEKYSELYKGDYRLLEKRTLKLTEVRTDPFPLTVCGKEQVTARLVTSKSRGKLVKGYIYFTSNKNITVEPKAIKISISDETSVSKTLKLNLKTSKLGVYYINYKLSSNIGNFKGRIPLIVIGDKGEVEVFRTIENEKEVLIIDNGLYLLKCSPDFGGTLYAIIKKNTDENNLLTSFPKPRPFSWMKSWHGGLTPDLMFDGKLRKEKWNADYSSIGKWVGVKVWTTATLKEHREYRGLKVVQHYLTKPYSNIILLLTEIHNPTHKYVEPGFSYYIFTNPGGKIANQLSVFSEGKWTEWESLGPEIIYPTSDNKQAIVYNERGALTLIGLESEEITIGAIDMGFKHGCHLYLYAEGLDYLKPNDTWRIMAYLVLTKSKEEAMNYEWLRFLKDLL